MIDVNNERFGKEIKKTLIDLDKTQLELAEKVGIKKSYLGDILQNNREAYAIREKIVSVIEQWKDESRCILNGK